MKTSNLLLLLVALTACSSEELLRRTPGPGTTPPVEGVFDPGTTVGGTENTFDHPAGIGGIRVADAREVLERMEEEGPPAYRARVHGCRKMRYGNLGRVLRELGVNLDAEGESSAGAMYRSADQALGVANYEARIPETTELTTASASRLFDILVQASPEVIANVESSERCRIGDRGVTIFDGAGRCDEEGLTCLLGEPASEEHVALCNQIVDRASSPERGRVLAVASILASMATCE